LIDSADLENVVKIQSVYRALTLSKFQNKPSPPTAPAIAWPAINKELADTNPFTYLNFVLGFAPATGPAAVEIPMRKRLANIGIEAGKPFSLDARSPQQKAEFTMGMTSGLEAIKATTGALGKDENGWHVATNGFGDRKTYAGNFSLRAAAAMAGIYGNDAVEVLYPLLATDGDGKKADTSTNRYTLTFTADQTRTRRDNLKYLSLIDAIALLHQHQRSIETKDVSSQGGSACGGKGRNIPFIRATLDDVELANKLAPEIFGQSLDELLPQTRRLLEYIKTIVRDIRKREDIEQHLALFSRRQLCELSGWTYSQVKRHLVRLQELEYIIPRYGRMGSTMRYELLIDANEPADMVHIGLLVCLQTAQIYGYDANLDG